MVATPQLSRPVTCVLSILLFIQCILFSSFAQSSSNPNALIGFVENTGQLSSFGTHKPVKDVLYKLASPTCEVYITTRGLSYVFRKEIKQKDSSTFHFEMERVDMNLMNAAISTKRAVISRVRYPVPIHIYANSSSPDTLSFADRVCFLNVYDKIDWVLYLKKEKNGNTTLKYDFILHPGADTRLLRIRYSPNAKLSSDTTGQVTIQSRLGNIREAAPIVYEEKSQKSVPVNVDVNGSYISYYFPDEIIKAKTIFDPELYWGTYLTSVIPGINYNDFVYGTNVETDSHGNIYVLLNTTAGVGFPTLDPGQGAYFRDISSTSTGGIQVVKFNPDGKLLWSTFFGQATTASVMVVNSRNDLYIIGHSMDPVPLKNNGGYFNSNFKRSFITKFSGAGVLLWSSYIGANTAADIEGFDASDIAADKNGRIYITGAATYYGLPFKDFGNGAYFYNTPSADAPAFVTVFDESCNLLWSTLIGSGYYMSGGPHITTDGNNNIIIVANPRNNTYPLVNDGGYFNNGGNNAVISSFNSQFVMTWSTSIPGIAFGLFSVTADRDNNIFIVGGGASGGFPTTDPGGGAFVDNGTNFGLSTGFIMKFLPTHELVWATRFANNSQMFLRKVIGDPTCDAIHIAGVMNDDDLDVPTMNGGCSNGFYFPSGSAITGTEPIYLTFKSSGKQIYTSVTDFPSEYYDTFWDFNVDPFGNLIYLYGDMSNFTSIPSAIKDPGNGAFFQFARNNLSKATILMKMRPSGLTANININAAAVCGCNNTVNAVVTCGEAPYTYQWSNGETGPSITNVCPGSYQVRIMDNNCRDTLIDFKVLPTPADIISFNSNVTPASCKKNNGIISVSSIIGGQSPYQYSINSGPLQATGLFSDLAPGKYKVSVVSAQSCDQFDSVQVDEIIPVSAVLLTLSPAHCAKGDGMVEINGVTGGTAPYNYSVDGLNYLSANKINSLSVGKKYLYVKDDNGCIYTDSFLINAVAGPSFISVNANDAPCNTANGSVLVNAVTGGSAPYTYSVDNTNFQSGTMFKDLSPGEYSLTAKDMYGCTASTPFTIGKSLTTVVKIKVEEVLVCYGTIVNFKAEMDGNPTGIQYNWNGNNGQAELNLPVTRPQSVRLKITNADGCSSEDSVLVALKNCDSSFDHCIVFPNAVTPNGDGKNDSFGPGEFRCAVDGYLLKIFNRYGELVFSTTDPYKRWDGLFKGAVPGNNSYIYSCEYKIEGQPFSKKGTFLMVR